MRGVLQFGSRSSLSSSSSSTVVGPLSFAVLSSSPPSYSFWALLICLFEVCVCTRWFASSFSPIALSRSWVRQSVSLVCSRRRESHSEFEPPRVCHLYHELYNQAKLIWESSSAYFYFGGLCFVLFLSSLPEIQCKLHNTAEWSWF